MPVPPRRQPPTATSIWSDRIRGLSSSSDSCSKRIECCESNPMFVSSSCWLALIPGRILRIRGRTISPRPRRDYRFTQAIPSDEQDKPKREVPRPHIRLTYLLLSDCLLIGVRGLNHGPRSVRGASPRGHLDLGSHVS